MMQETANIDLELTKLLRTYNPSDHYWIRDDGAIYSSKADRIVEAIPAEFTGTPTRWPVDTGGNQTNAALYDVLSVYSLGISLIPHIEIVSAGYTFKLSKLDLNYLLEEISVAVALGDTEVTLNLMDVSLTYRSITMTVAALREYIKELRAL